jgi:hypothetical protein
LRKCVAGAEANSIFVDFFYQARRMKKTFALLIVLLFGGSLLEAQVFTPFADKIYVTEYVSRPINIPGIKISFSELSDSSKLKQSLKKIEALKKFKSAPTEFEGMVFMNPALRSDSLIPKLKKGSDEIGGLHFYLDTNSYRFDSLHVVAHINTFLPLETVLQPFYIGKAEVTNGEYMEFVQYIIDSLARFLLVSDESKFSPDYGEIKDGKVRLKWKTPVNWKSEDEYYREALMPLYLPLSERFYSRREIDSRKLNWVYFLPPDSSELKKITEKKSGAKSQELISWKKQNKINVYPDTLCWVHDIATDVFEPLTNMYFWHPAYKNYPVAGLSEKQISAFLIWKTKQVQEQLDKKGIKLKVECDLPTVIEWNMAVTGSGEQSAYFSKQRKIIPLLFANLSLKDQSENSPEFFSEEVAKTDSIAKTNTFGIFAPAKLKRLAKPVPLTSFKKNAKWSELNKQLIDNKNNPDLNWVFPTACQPDKLSVKKGTISENASNYVRLMKNKNLYFLNGNLSECMKERFFVNDSLFVEDDKGQKRFENKVEKRNSMTFPYEGHFEPWLRFYMKILNYSNLSGIAKHKQEVLESFLDYRADYRLVQGANFYDMGNILDGANKFTFVSEDSAHCTLGFRYVIRFREK